MNIYPAIQSRMGSWQYYVVKMSMRELAESVKLASDFYDDPTLDEAIQRILDQSRVKKDLVNYLTKQEDRFFSSIVVAVMGGAPRWYPVSIEDDQRFEIIASDPRLNDAFGCLAFDGTQDYYALDGQHRLAAIKTLIDSSQDESRRAPEGFKNEEISVIVVVPPLSSSKEDFLVRYRRLFGNLNRYAKATDQVTNIIMDEDDAFAILTRRLITEHGFFQCTGRQMESARIKTRKGKNLNKNDIYFTSLETLYSMNIKLLESRTRKNNGWIQDETNVKEFIKYRPDEEYLDALYEELTIYWDALIEELPELRSTEPHKMRDHNAPNGDGNTQSSALFWPITQELLADIVRDLIDRADVNDTKPSSKEVKTALLGLNKINWKLHETPWRNLILIPESNSQWKIRNEERKNALVVAKCLVRWQLGIDQLDLDEVEKLRESWKNLLLPALEPSDIDSLWSDIIDGVER